jgi:monoamine oxidase
MPRKPPVRIKIERTPKKKSCVIIGAGLAGLSAAYKLTQAKWEVILLEARDRIGGRVFSYHFHENPDLYCELGGEWIGNSHDAVKGLCRRLKLDLTKHQYQYSFAELGTIAETFKVGKWPFEKSLKKTLEKSATKALNPLGSKKEITKEQKCFDQQDWWTYLHGLHFSEKDLLRKDLMDSTDFGESIRQTGAFSAASEYYGEGTNSTDEMDWRIVGGNSRLINALAEQIGLNCIHTSMEAKRVTQRNGCVTVHAEDTRTFQFAAPRPKRKLTKKKLPTRMNTFKARYCICTVPARVLTQIEFYPDLSEVQRLAARDLQYARIMKTVLLFKTRFWEKRMGKQFSCFTDGTSDFIFAASLGQPGTQGILCSYSIGDKADDLAARGPEDLRELIAADLSKLFPGEDTTPIAVERYAWAEDKYTRGAYAFYRPGQWFPIREALQRPHRLVYFAGEHIADEQGFMDGAVDTGHAAARLVMTAHRRPNKKTRRR